MKPGDPAQATGGRRDHRAVPQRQIERCTAGGFSPIPPKGVNLQLPMSDALQRVLRNPTDASDPRLYR
jgi:hypothetical protein